MKYLLLIFFYFSLIFNISSQVLKPIQWDEVEMETIDGDTVDLIFRAKIDADWYLYSSDFDEDLGPTLAKFSFDENETFEVIEDINPINPKRAYDSLWEGYYTYFKGQATFRQRIKILKTPVQISGQRIYQVCKDTDGKCILFEDDFEIGKAQKELKDEVSTSDKKTLWTILITSFFAGIIALLTPCVYPMIPITLSIFLKQGNSRRKAISMALVYGLSIVIFFSLIGFFVSLIWGFSSLNELSTHWAFNVFIFIVFLIFSLSFFGLFELTLPSRLVNKIDAKADKGGYLGVFFMAITLVVVSFSCTFPIVGTALISTLNGGSIIEGVISMVGFSLAFAIPFSLLAFFPLGIKSLPKSGSWLNTVKVILGFLELALALKFLSIADLSYHWGILDRDVFIAIWIVIFSLLGFYLLNKIQLPHDSSDKNSISVGRLFLSIIVFSFTLYLVPGLWGAPLKALSGFLPPLSTHSFNLLSVKRGGVICDEVKYSSIFKTPNGLQGYFDLEQAVACAKQQSKPLFIDFTGHGCVNCREMEQKVLSDPQILEKLSSDFIVVSLYIDDRTVLPKNEWFTSEIDGKVKKTIGQQNADFQIAKYNNNAQPYYLIVDETLKALVPPQAYNLDIESFKKFLKKGANNFKL